MKAVRAIACSVLILAICQAPIAAGQAGSPLIIPSEYDLVFNRLAESWDEAIPLGNGLIGVLVWRKGSSLRLSLDRADLWDLRPAENLDRPEWSFSWVRNRVLKQDYKTVQDLFDAPYERNPAPTKIPGAALEFDDSELGEVSSVRLLIQNALCVIEWKSGARLSLFVHATEPVGWFRFEKIKAGVSPSLIPPAYGPQAGGTGNPEGGQALSRLDYGQGPVMDKGNETTYTQMGWNGFFYTVHAAWNDVNEGMEGVFSISAHFPDRPPAETAEAVVGKALSRGFLADLASHFLWWSGFWQKSGLTLPDPVLEKQWYLEMYKLGSAARTGAPPISLQAVWTADNGRLPPWKGDFHHDLNTQLSYWPAYSSNHLELETPFLDWLWGNVPEFRRYTKVFFGTGGQNVPGVTTLRGAPMGGWIQYSFSPTVSAWLGHHFYLRWRYSLDRGFLAEKAYPWIRDAAVHLDQLSVKDAAGRRKLPLSSTPEIHDNSLDAWFTSITNYDLALIRWTYQTASELAAELDLTEEAAKWEKVLSEWPDLAVSGIDNSLVVAPGEPLMESHRHFSHLLAIHPLGLVDWSNGLRDQEIILNSLARLEKFGPGGWRGYSYSWLGNMKARARDGEGAARALRTFADCFCLPNSFHVNGDQSGTGKSNFTDRPFTLEGNFAFAAAVQEMLLQSHTGVIELFPAVPPAWKNVGFRSLRAMGAFLVTAEIRDGRVRDIAVYSEKGARLRLRNPFAGKPFRMNGIAMISSEEIIDLLTFPGQTITLELL